MTCAAGQLILVRGIVTATKGRMESVRVDRKTGYGNIRTTPELWLRDEGGTEHRYSGELFGAAQPGHDVAVGATVVLALPGLFVWGALAEPIGLLDATFTGVGFQIYLVMLEACAFIGVSVWAKGYRERTDTLKTEIDQLLIDQQKF